MKFVYFVIISLVFIYFRRKPIPGLVVLTGIFFLLSQKGELFENDIDNNVIDNNVIPGKTIWIYKPSDEIKQSWIKNNPEWNIQEITLNKGQRLEKVKIDILAKHGGVWVDSHLLCKQPLEDWIYDLLESTGFWMNEDQTLIVSIRQSEPIKQWKRTYIPPIDFKNNKATFTSNKVVVSPDCKHIDSIDDMIKICKKYKAQLILYDKCNFCKHIPDGIYCRPLPNLGRDMGTFLYFAIKYYNDDTLPETIYFMPTNLKKHNRKQRLEEMLSNPDFQCYDHIGTERNFELTEYEGIPLKRASKFPFSKWYEKYIASWKDDERGPCWNGVMKTNKQNIRRTPLDKLKILYDQTKEDNNLEVVHYIERSLNKIF